MFITGENTTKQNIFILCVFEIVVSVVSVAYSSVVSVISSSVVSGVSSSIDIVGVSVGVPSVVVVAKPIKIKLKLNKIKTYSSQ